MIDEEMTERCRPTVHEDVSIVPMQRDGWLVWSDGGVEGPAPIVAVATCLSLASAQGNVHRYGGGQGKKFNYEVEYPVDVTRFPDAPLEGAQLRFLCLVDNAAEQESLWIEQKYVVFTEAAAKDLAARRATEFRAAHPRIAEFEQQLQERP